MRDRRREQETDTQAKQDHADHQQWIVIPAVYHSQTQAAYRHDYKNDSAMRRAQHSTGGLLARPAEAPGADTSVSVCALPFLP